MYKVPMSRIPRFSTPELLARRAELSRQRGRWAPGSVALLGDADARGIGFLRQLGLRPVVRLDYSEPASFLDTLLQAARSRADVALRTPWHSRRRVVPTSDHQLGEELYSALVHAETHGDRPLRSALDARRGYRRILAGADPDPDDPLDLRWDLTHSPEETPRLTFLLTRNCQLRCRYCMVKLWDEDSLDADQMKGLDILFAAKSDAVRMQFYGGEPLLRPRLFRALVERARQLEQHTGKRLSIILITNGIAMTPEVADFCVQHDIEVLVSLDGPSDLHDARRMPHTRPLANIPRAADDTSTAARRALSLLWARGARTHVIVTITPQDVDRTAEALLAIQALGAPTAQICYAMGVEWGTEATERLCDQFAHLAHVLQDDVAAGRFDWVNLYRNEPILIDTALQLETDGRICFMNECMFEKYKQARNYGIGHVQSIDSLRSIGSTRFHNYAMLTAIYGDKKDAYRRIMLDNIRVGHAIRSRLGAELGPLPTAGET